MTTLADVRRWADALAGLPAGPRRSGCRSPTPACPRPCASPAGRWKRRSERGRSSVVAAHGAETQRELPYGVLGLQLAWDRAPLLLARTVGIAGAESRKRSAA